MKVTTELYCTICMNDEQGDWTSLIPCGHLFHEHCVRQWVNPPPPERGAEKRKRPDWCPLCRSKILRPESDSKKKRNTKENSRFRKVIFPNEVKIDLSSSPARTQVLPPQQQLDDRGEGTSGIHRRRGVVVDSSDDELLRGAPPPPLPHPLANGEAILTESESDEDTARPARAVYPRNGEANARGSTPSDGNNNVNATLGEARATIARKNEELAQLRHQLADVREELQSTIEGVNTVTREAQMIEARLKEKLEEVRILHDEVRKLRDDKRGLSKSIKVEVEKVGELSKTNKKLIEEITLLKDKHSKLKHEHDQLEASYNTTIEDYQTRLESAKQAEETYKDRFTRVFELNRVNQRKVDLKRERIKSLEAELAKYKNAEEARRKLKGKGRAVQDDGEEASFAAPRSRQVSNKSVDDTSYLAEKQDEDFEESLLVTEVPDSEGHEVYEIGDDDEDAFADLDIVLPGPKPARKAKAVLSRDPLKEWTNNDKYTSTTTSKKRALTSVTSASDKWADMALFGTNKAMAHGEKKKAKVAF
ncbi:hypothetical protein P389DRAFT_165194 [Cystobasidium minutum MCA 4210]|uniref:uncharacterized protein n=1 Tax=Cystobasidium minutum MCA 4210 TaxID=1397322 RepID=UPI0034CFC723|eukprot:jgi/Rhomi1/165194/fgenesh1_kg.1_\